MKYNNSMGGRFLPVLAMGLLASGAASGQTTTNFYQNGSSGAAAFAGTSATGSLGSIGFTDSQWTVLGAAGTPGSASDGGGITAQAGGSFGVNRQSIDYTFNPAGLTGTIDSIVLYLYVTTLGPAGVPTSYNIYDDAHGTGNVVGTFSIGAAYNTYYAINIPATLGTTDGIFSLGYTPGANAIQPAFTVVSDSGVAANGPGISITTTVIPEASTALLGALGSLVMFRRRRA